jgi:hypothetical protein
VRGHSADLLGIGGMPQQPGGSRTANLQKGAPACILVLDWFFHSDIPLHPNCIPPALGQRLRPCDIVLSWETTPSEGEKETNGR